MDLELRKFCRQKGILGHFLCCIYYNGTMERARRIINGRSFPQGKPIEAESRAEEASLWFILLFLHGVRLKIQ